MDCTPASTSAAGGAGRFSVVPSPSSPETLPPQQRTPPVVVTAQVCSGPAAMSCAPDSTSLAGGQPWFSVVPSPSWPEPFSPQQRTPPERSSAQLW
jgi:hypothetical protein